MSDIGSAEDKDFRRKWRDRNDGREWIDKLIPFLPKDLRPICAEIGVWEGEHSWIILNNLKPSKLVLIDPFKNMSTFVGIRSADDEDSYNFVKETFSKFPQVEILRKTSVQAAKMYPDEYFDIVYIDGIHSYKSVKEDVNTWWPKVKTTGYLCGHDALTPDVLRVLGEFGKHGLMFSPNHTEWIIPRRINTGSP